MSAPRKQIINTVSRSIKDYGRIQLKVTDKGKLLTTKGLEPVFNCFAGQPVVVMTVEQHKHILNHIWEQRYLILSS